MLLSVFQHSRCFLRRIATLPIFCLRLLFLTSILLIQLIQLPYANAVTLDSPLKFTNISTDDGLSQSYVFSITQDKQGFIWIATEDGLNRYDGKNFVHYRHNVSDEHSIADNFIRKVFIDNKGVLWVGTQNGLSRYNPDHDNFDNFLAVDDNNNSLRDNVVWEIYQDNQNTLWIATAQGLHKLVRKHNNFERIKIPNSTIQLAEIRSFFQDNNNNYWIGTYDQGIYIANAKFTYAIPLNQKNKWNLNISAKSLFDIKEIDQHYWLATEQGLYVVNRNYQISKHLTTASTKQKLLSNEIRSIERFDDSHVWLGGKKGLNIVNLLNDKLQSYQSNAKPNSLSENWILTIFKDNANNMWLGNLATGLDKYNPITSLFQHKLSRYKDKNVTINSFAQTTDNKIWFSSEQLGLNYISADNSTIKVKLAIENDIALLKAGANNQLWLLTYLGDLYTLNAATNKLIKHEKWLKQANYNKNLSFIINKHNLWYIDNQGHLSAYNTLQRSFSHFHPQDNSELRAFQQDSDNNIWLTSNKNQLYKFDLESKKFKKILIKLTPEFQINEAMNLAINNEWIWFSSYSQGLMLINKHNFKITIFNESNDLINNSVNAILIDNNGNAWLSATNGISVINPNTHSIRNFSQDYALNDNEFIRSSAFKSSKQIFYFGGLNGFQQFSPLNILKISQKVPKPILTNLLIANKRIAIGKNHKGKTNSPFKIIKQLNQLKTLTLAYSQSPFSIEFTSPNAKLPLQIHYRYKLVGLEKNWIEAGINNQRATYTNLSAGEYTFELQAYDVHHPTQQQQSKRLTIEILPPWWLSTQALAVYALIVVLIITYFILQIQNRRQYHRQIQQSEERLKLSLWGSGDEMWDWNINTNKIYRSNIWEGLDFPQDGIRNLSKEQLIIQQNSSLSAQQKQQFFKHQTNIHPQDIDRVHHAIEQIKENKNDHFETTYRVKGIDKYHKKHWIWVLDRGKIVERCENQLPTRMTGTLKDISQIKNAEERLKLFAKCIENISDAVVIYNRQFKVVDVNKAYQKITGKTKMEMLNQALNFPLYASSFIQTVKKHLLSQGNWHGEIEDNRKNNELYYIDLNIDIIRDENNNVSHFVAVFSDITERKENESELRKLANSDTLTGLPNRSYFQAIQARLVKNKSPHALLVFDLDHFKKINDSLGHEFGDILLCRIAERIINSAREQDTVYRLGGDEFGLIIEKTNDIHTITSIAKSIIKNIAEPLKIKNHELVLHSSIGIVLYPEDGGTPQELLKNADTAMYHAKGSGGNKYQFFNDSMNKQAVKRLQIENLIRFGLKHDYFSVFYQPKIEIATGKIAGMEALVRFEHPSKGIVSPITFIPVSEETGQIIDIGEVVLRKACFATKAWVDTGLFTGRIAVNLSAVQFTQPNLVEVIAGILAESQLEAKYLELEITEGTVMNSPQTAIDIMLQIRAMGIHLSLDDFGTGYSSLAYLKKFPLNTLKIDKAFVDDIEHSEQGRNMVATIITIAHNLGLHVVAEGVEQQLQLDFLANLHCEQLQGYLYSKPLTENDFYKYLLSYKIANKSTSFTKS